LGTQHLSLISFLNNKSVVLRAVIINFVYFLSFSGIHFCVEIQFSFPGSYLPSISLKMIKKKGREQLWLYALYWNLFMLLYKRLQIGMAEIIYFSFVLHFRNINEIWNDTVKWKVWTGIIYWKCDKRGTLNHLMLLRRKYAS
jgi:hypothetical protein